MPSYRRIAHVLTEAVVMVLLTVFSSTATHGASLTFDFESGNLTGWTSVGAIHGYDDTAFNPLSNNPVSHDRIGPVQGDYYVDSVAPAAYGGGWNNAWTGIIESDSFILAPGATITMLVGGGSSTWTGDPDSPGANVHGIAVEREVAPGDWENTHWESGGGNNLTPRTWDASAYAGDTLRLRLYDTGTGGWDWAALDDVRISWPVPPGAVISIR